MIRIPDQRLLDDGITDIGSNAGLAPRSDHL